MNDGMETKDPKNPARTPRRRHDRGIFERPVDSGAWWIRYVDETGRLHREKVGPKGLALRVYQKRKTEIQERRFFPERIRRREISVADAIRSYVARIKGRLRSYRNCLRYAELWTEAIGQKTLRQIVPGDIERFVAKRIREVSAATINRELAFLKRVFNVAIADGDLEINPFRSIRMFKENNQRSRFLHEDEEARLREALGPEHWLFVAVAIHTGLRRSEQFLLRWEHVDFTTGFVTIPRSKSGEARRVPMNETVRSILRSRESRLKSAWVFPSLSGSSPIDGNNFMHRVFLPALKRAGIDGFRWHDLRHTFASRLVMAGVDLRTVQELLGHHNITMTLRYSHLSPGHQLHAVRYLDLPTDTTTDTDQDDESVDFRDKARNAGFDWDFVARPEGFEPPTYRSVVCRSNPLS